MTENYVITLSRQFGSLGRTIAQRLSENLDIEFWDRDIVETTAKRMGQPVSVISNAEEVAKKTFLFRQKETMNLATYSISDEIFEVEKNIIRDAAKKNSCIIVGRCGDFILQDMPNHLSVYIFAPYEARLKNCVEELGMDEKTAKKMIREVDMARSYYQKKYCPAVKSEYDFKDMLIDSSRFGVNQTAEIIAEIARKMFLTSSDN